jgi:hypothetical protein
MLGAGQWQWVSPDETRRVPFGESPLAQLAEDADLCVGGDGLAWLHTQGLLAECVRAVQVRVCVSLWCSRTGG